MSCCCEKERDQRTREPSEYNGLAASDLEEIQIDSRPHRFLVPDGCVLDETTGTWSRLIVSPGYSSAIVSPASLNASVTASSHMRLETYDGVNNEHNVKQKFLTHYRPSCTEYDTVYQGWYNQAIQKWQVVVRATSGAIALMSVSLDGSLSETVLTAFWLDDGDILTHVDSYDQKTYLVRVRTDHVNPGAVLLHVDVIYTGEDIDDLNPGTAPNSIVQDCFVYIEEDGTPHTHRMATYASWEPLDQLSMNETSRTEVNGSPISYHRGTYVDCCDGEYVYGVLRAFTVSGIDVFEHHYAAAWDFDGNLWLDSSKSLGPSQSNLITEHHVTSTSQYGFPLSRASGLGPVFGTMISLEAGNSIYFYRRIDDPFDPVLLPYYATFDITNGVVEVGTHDPDAQPILFARNQPSWGKTSTGLVTVGTYGTIYRYCSNAGVCTDHTSEDYRHYTVASDRVWGSAIVDDPGAAGNDLLQLEVSDAGGAAGIDPGNWSTRLLHKVYKPANEWGDTFTATTGAYAVSVTGDDITGVLLSELVETYFLKIVCKAQCVIECIEDENTSDDFATSRVWYVTCKTKCACRPEDSPAMMVADSIGRLFVHTCGGLTGTCVEGGECLFRVVHQDYEPGEFVVVDSPESYSDMFRGLDKKVTIVAAGGDCECYCPCINEVDLWIEGAIVEVGGFFNGGLVNAPCRKLPYAPDCSDDPPTPDCETPTSVFLQTSITTACHSWTGSLELTKVGAKYEIYDFEIPGTDGCLRLDAEFVCAVPPIVTAVIRSADSMCSSDPYYRYTPVTVGGTYALVVNDPGNNCCCPCEMCGLAEELDWEFDLYNESDVFEATYTGTVVFSSGSETSCQWVMEDPESLIPMQVTVTKLGPSSYQVSVTAGSGFDGEPVILDACPSGIVTIYATGNAGESTLSNVRVNFG